MKKLLRALGLSLAVAVPALAGPSSPPAGNYITNVSTNANVQIFKVSSGTVSTQLNVQNIRISGTCTGAGCGTGGASTLGVNYNGVSVTTPTAQINFKGPGVVVTQSGSTATVTISSWPAGGGGGSGGYNVQPATVAFNLAQSLQTTSMTATAFNASLTSVTVTGTGGLSLAGTGAGQLAITQGADSSVSPASGVSTLWATSSSSTLVWTDGVGVSTYLVVGSSISGTTGHLAVWSSLGKLVDGGVPGTGGGASGASLLGVNYNGVSVTSPTAQINFVGPGVTVTATGSTATVTISSWSGGGGSPSAPNYSVQVDSNGAFGGSSNFTYDGSTLTVSGVAVTTFTNVSSFTVSGAYFDVSASTTNLGRLRLNGSAGTNGQVLTSGGAGTIPTWTTVSGGGLTAGASYYWNYPSSGTFVDTQGISVSTISVSSNVFLSGGYIEMDSSLFNNNRGRIIWNTSSGGSIDSIGYIGAGLQGIGLFNTFSSTQPVAQVFESDGVSTKNGFAIRQGNPLRFYDVVNDTNSANTHYIEFSASSTILATHSYVLPSVGQSEGQVLTVHADSSTYWATPSAGGTSVSSGAIVQTLISSVTVSSTSAATIFANTGLSITITPKSTSDYIRLYVHGPLSSSAGAPVFLTIAKAGVNMMASSGCSEFDPDATLISTAFGQGACVIYDTAPVTSATTYTIQIKTTSGTGGFGDTNVTSYLIAEEINPSGGSQASGSGGGGYNVEPATVTFKLTQGVFIDSGLVVGDINNVVGSTSVITSSMSVVLASAPINTAWITLTLPSAAANPGLDVMVYKVNGGTQAVRIQGANGDLIESTGTVYLNAQFQHASLHSLGAVGWGSGLGGIQATPARIYSTPFSQHNQYFVSGSSYQVVCPINIPVPVQVTGYTYGGQTGIGGTKIAIGIVDINGGFVCGTAATTGATGAQTLNQPPFNLAPGPYYIAVKETVAGFGIDGADTSGANQVGCLTVDGGTLGGTATISNFPLASGVTVGTSPAISIIVSGGKQGY